MCLGVPLYSGTVADPVVFVIILCRVDILLHSFYVCICV